MDVYDCDDLILDTDVEFVIDDKDNFKGLYFKEPLKKALSSISYRERKIILSRIVVGETLETMGDYFGLSRERIRQIEKRGLAKIRESLGLPKEINKKPRKKLRKKTVKIEPTQPVKTEPKSKYIQKQKRTARETIIPLSWLNTIATKQLKLEGPCPDTYFEYMTKEALDRNSIRLINLSGELVQETIYDRIMERFALPDGDAVFLFRICGINDELIQQNIDTLYEKTNRK